MLPSRLLRCRKMRNGDTTYEIDFNRLNLSAPTSGSSQMPGYSVIIIPGIDGAFKKDDKSENSLRISSITTQELPIYLQRIAKFKEMVCAGRS